MAKFDHAPTLTSEQAYYLRIRERFGFLMSACFSTVFGDEAQAMGRRLKLNSMDHPLDAMHSLEPAVYDAAAFHGLRGGESQDRINPG